MLVPINEVYDRIRASLSVLHHKLTVPLNKCNRSKYFSSSRIYSFVEKHSYIYGTIIQRVKCSCFHQDL